MAVYPDPYDTIITSLHHMEKTEAGLKGHCIREIVTKIIILLIHKKLHYTVSDALEICYVIYNTA